MGSVRFLANNGMKTAMFLADRKRSARATSAAPPFFKTFFKSDTQSSYLDGALYHNCPVWVAHHERKLIWGDVASAAPDILLSIGTGKNGDDEDARTATGRGQIPESANNAASSTGKARAKSAKTFLPLQLFNIAAERFDRLMECNSIWKNFTTETSATDTNRAPQGTHRRLIRINPDLQTKVPRLDAIEELGRLEKAAKQNLADNNGRIREVAHRLVASTFFFEKDRNSVKQGLNGFSCSGTCSVPFPVSPHSGRHRLSR